MADALTLPAPGPAADAPADAGSTQQAARPRGFGSGRVISARAAVVWIRRHLGLTVAGVVVVLVLAWALLPSIFASGDPLRGIPAQKLRGPSAEHWFGTDNLGRDLYTRVVHGTGLSVSATVFAVVLGLVVGSLVGLVSGAVGGGLDSVLMRVVDVLLSIPDLLVALAMITVLGLGTRNVAIAVGVSLIARFARVMRGEVLRVRRAPYVEAAFASGVRWHTVLFRHVLRNAYGPVAALAAVDFGVAVLFVASLSFLGYGAVPPTPEWGSLVSDGRGFLATAWWMTTLPGLVIVALVLSTQRIARALQKDGAR